MKLSEILKGIEYEILNGNLDVEVSNIHYDSRYVKEGGMFIAVSGYALDGHDFIYDVTHRGIDVVLVEKEVEVKNGVTVIKVKDTRKEMINISRNFFDVNMNKVKIIGVTGTNGKTSVTTIAYDLLKESGVRVGLIGSNGIRYMNGEENLGRTTPNGYEMMRILRKMIDEKIEVIFMEVSSHALELHRVDGLDFEMAVFTNLTQDHLDFHKTIENYRDAKLKLFKMAKIGIFNLDDPSAMYFMNNSTCDNKYTVSIEAESDYRAKDIKLNIHGLKYNLLGFDVEFNTPGRFSVYNTLEAIAIANKLGIDMEVIVESMKKVEHVSGRFETYKIGDKNIIIDYAHAPDGLEQILKTSKELTKGKIITVFGCGGNRDKTKRPIMGKVAAKYSDYVVIVPDNPRDEEIDEINKGVEVGVKEIHDNYITFNDRKDGIVYAMDKCEKDDIIVIAGKGNEDYIEIKGVKHYYKDYDVISNYLN
ncbi:MAG: UDP-N-acetylmuramoyl-L-alanyl-D-glutamate--2,6-diaminopimelate ligase [Clostridia bacterium]|nr:UDP-N-acetylmuramoyl-L-alanyl-D-glutamate--2,6-diaminopimelate ligase [Clostridia bacterium]